MTDLGRIIELIKASSAATAAVAGLVAAVLGFVNRRKIHRVSILINGRMEQLLAAAIDKGRIVERNEHRANSESQAETFAALTQTIVETSAAAVVESVVLNVGAKPPIKPNKKP
jgi:hypothetical protein